MDISVVLSSDGISETCIGHELSISLLLRKHLSSLSGHVWRV